MKKVDFLALDEQKIGARLAEVMASKAFTTAQRRAALGSKYRHVSSYVKNRAGCTPSNILDAMMSLGVDPYWYLLGEGEMIAEDMPKLDARVAREIRALNGLVFYALDRLATITRDLPEYRQAEALAALMLSDGASLQQALNEKKK